MSQPKPKSFETVYLDIDVQKIIPLIDKNRLFLKRWGFVKGATSEAEHNDIIANKATPLLLNSINNIINSDKISPKLAYAHFNCRSITDGLIVMDRELNTVAQFYFPTKQGRSYSTLSEHFLQTHDIISMFVATVGQESKELVNSLYDANTYSDYYYLNGLLVELTECLADYAHSVMREDLSLETDGFRFSFGYPSCPSLEDNKSLLNLLKSDSIGVTISDNLQMLPEHSVSGCISWQVR